MSVTATATSSTYTGLTASQSQRPARTGRKAPLQAGPTRRVTSTTADVSMKTVDEEDEQDAYSDGHDDEAEHHSEFEAESSPDPVASMTRSRKEHHPSTTTAALAQHRTLLSQVRDHHC